MSLLKQINEKVNGRPTVDLKNSDATDAGTYDVVDKGASDVSFSTLRNTINTNGEITGSDVANYLERAGELNDEVDTIQYGLETNDGEIVKVFINAAQADDFGAALKKLLGIEDDIEEVINRLSTDFDIVDVIWPDGDNDVDLEDIDLDTALDSDHDDDDDDLEVYAQVEKDSEAEAEAEKPAADGKNKSKSTGNKNKGYSLLQSITSN